MTEENKDVLHDGLAYLSLTCSEDQVKAIEQYIALLEKWNKKINLTAKQGREEIVTYHILDSLAIAEHLQGNVILDIGSGAGLPGIPLAIVFPEKQFVLLDALEKRVHFLQQVCITLGLKNVKPVHSRVENYSADELFDVIMARAVATPDKIISMSEHILSRSGSWLLMIGQAEEHVSFASESDNRSIHALDVPFIEGQRHVLMIEGKERG